MTSRYSEVWKKDYEAKSPHPAEPVVRGELVWNGIRLRNLIFLVDTGADYTIIPPKLLILVEGALREEGRLGPDEELIPSHTKEIDTASQSKVEVPFFKVHLSTELDNFGVCEVGTMGNLVLLGRDLMEKKNLILVFDSVQKMLIKAARIQAPTSNDQES